MGSEPAAAVGRTIHANQFNSPAPYPSPGTRQGKEFEEGGERWKNEAAH